MLEFFQNRFVREEFDYQTLVDMLKNYSRPRDKISDLIRKGSIVRVKKGLYVFGERYRRRPYSRALLANLIYGPSCVSLDWALQYHGMIPERVDAVTSVTVGRSRRFETPVGLFIYRNVPMKGFSCGMTRVEAEAGTAFLIATPEKAICDKVREDRGTGQRSRKDMRRYLTEDLRIDETALAGLNPARVGEIASRYRSAKIRLLKECIAGLSKQRKGGADE